MDDDAIWLLLHGTPLTPEVWDGVRSALAARHPVEAPPLPRPSVVPRAQTEIAQTEIARRVLDEVAHPDRRLHVVGHSFGGQVALELAIAAPARVASLTILCSRASPFPAFAATAEAIRRDGVPDVEASIARWFLPDEVAANGPVVRYARQCLAGADPERWADDLDAIAVYDRRTDLARITVPTSIIAAESDRVGTPDEMAAIAAAVPGARYECLADASHMSPFTDPAALAGRIAAVVA